jgi:hypothetical protein
MLPIKGGPTGKELREMQLKLTDITVYRMRQLTREEISKALSELQLRELIRGEITDIMNKQAIMIIREMASGGMAVTGAQPVQPPVRLDPPSTDL